MFLEKRMTNLTGKERAQYVQGMFTRIAYRYDFMNRLMTEDKMFSGARK